jgi:hypothetical protein
VQKFPDIDMVVGGPVRLTRFNSTGKLNWQTQLTEAALAFKVVRFKRHPNNQQPIFDLKDEPIEANKST